MNFYAEHKNLVLHEGLKQALATSRWYRGFKVQSYIEKKVQIINEYMEKHRRTACVVAISGGIDSAVTYALVSEAKKQADSPIQEIVPIFLPVYKSEGATNQEDARAKAQELISLFGNETLVEIDLSSVHAKLKETVDEAMGIFGDGWASGQLVSYLRTPTYYYATSLLSQKGLAPIVFGTTNRDEGAYLGYFGKASDGMVDVQTISDLHKNEVYQVGEKLGVPDSIMKATPTGDMYDNRSDEEVFGATYDFVELYLYYLDQPGFIQKKILRELNDEEREQFSLLKQNLDDLHNYNKHKYLGASPAVHLDVIRGKVKGGWKYNNFKGDVK